MPKPQAHGWTKTGSNSIDRSTHYVKGNVGLDYSRATHTATTTMHHPTKGDTQLTRPDLTNAEVERVLDNPRSHTGKGFYTRRASFIIRASKPSESQAAMSERRHQSKPEAHGWTKTGSNEQSRVEHYTRDNVKMDYYPTTGTVKTSMDHPTQGKTQTFRRDLSDAGFEKVLDNPRSHTGQGYQRRK